MSRLFFIIPIIGIFLSCHKDSDEVITIIDYPDPPSILVTSTLVTVIDEASADDPAEGITFGGHSFPPGAFMLNRFKGSGLNRDYEMIRIRTAGGHAFYKVQPLIENDINYTHLHIPEVLRLQGNTTSREDFSVEGLARLIVPAHSLLKADSTTYEGDYVIHLTLVKPGDSDAAAIPSFAGINGQHQYAGLIFSHLYWIAATTPPGDPLTFTNNAYLVTSGAVGSTWAFNPEKSIWTEMPDPGTSQQDRIFLQQPGYYAHAEALPMVYTRGILNLNGIAAPHYPISIDYAGQRQTVYTTNKGQWAAQLPVSTNGVFKLTLPCGQVVEQPFSTGTNDQQMIDINVTDLSSRPVRLMGTAVDCAANPLTEHYTILNNDTSAILFLDQSAIDIPVPACQGQDLNILTYDPANHQQGPEVKWEIADTIDMHNSIVCNQAREEYLFLSVSGERKIYWDLFSMRDSDLLIIGENEMNPEIAFTIFVEGLEKGEYEDTMLNILFEDKHLGTRGYALNCPTATSGCGFTFFTISHFADEEGEWIRGHFEGKFWIKTFFPLTAGYRPVVGDFQVYREF